MRFLSVLLFTVLGLTGCDLAPTCTTQIEPGFAVTVVDSVAGTNLAPEATVQVSDDMYVGELAPDNGIYEGPFDQERPGTYEVEVTHPDYLTWRRDGVRVEEDECHVITRELTARLMPDSS